MNSNLYSLDFNHAIPDSQPLFSTPLNLPEPAGIQTQGELLNFISQPKYRAKLCGSNKSRH
jgi:hypothetical protein